MRIAYIHGFLSGPHAVKATILKNYLEEHGASFEFVAPDFPDTPQEAIDSLDEWMRSYDPDDIFLVGSSMGGFLSTILQVRYGVGIALINPCTHPQEYFSSLIGPQHNDSTGRDFVLEPHMITTLEQLDAEACGYDPHRTLVLLQRGDEVLDYRKSLEFYAKSNPVVSDGGCHAFENFSAVVPRILDFAQALKR